MKSTCCNAPVRAFQVKPLKYECEKCNKECLTYDDPQNIPTPRTDDFITAQIADHVLTRTLAEKHYPSLADFSRILERELTTTQLNLLKASENYLTVLKERDEARKEIERLKVDRTNHLQELVRLRLELGKAAKL